MGLGRPVEMGGVGGGVEIGKGKTHLKYHQQAVCRKGRGLIGKEKLQYTVCRKSGIHHNMQRARHSLDILMQIQKPLSNQTAHSMYLITLISAVA